MYWLENQMRIRIYSKPVIKPKYRKNIRCIFILDTCILQYTMCPYQYDIRWHRLSTRESFLWHIINVNNN